MNQADLQAPVNYLCRCHVVSYNDIIKFLSIESCNEEKLGEIHLDPKTVAAETLASTSCALCYNNLVDFVEGWRASKLLDERGRECPATTFNNFYQQKIKKLQEAIKEADFQKIISFGPLEIVWSTRPSEKTSRTVRMLFPGLISRVAEEES